MQHESDQPEQLTQRLAHQLERVVPQYGSVIRRVLGDLDGEDRMTIPQFRALQAVSHRGQAGALNLELARQLGVAAPSMTAMIDGLVDRGLVDRSIDPDNRRQVNIVLTTRGQERYQAISEAIEERLADGFRSLSDTEQQGLLAALDNLDRVLKRLGQFPSRTGAN
ncbi:MAG: MarR family transcriptional regulator [Thermomicrobiales bacterium]|nr:MarR family transcriptional regulator [Thermomicrobiales bacterium]